MWRHSLALGLLMTHWATAAEPNQLTPILANPGKVFLEMDFNTDFTVEPGHQFFKLGQGTTWIAKDGMLVGTESSPAYQAKKRDQGNGHLGTAPRLQFPNSPKDVILKYSFKIVGGKRTLLLPMIESGHHLRRIYFGAAGSKILVDHEQTSIAESELVLELDTWYHVMLEIKDNEFLVRFQAGPTIYGSHPGVGAEFTNYDIGITATDKGIIYLDNLTIWQAGSVQQSWPETKRKFEQAASLP